MQESKVWSNVQSICPRCEKPLRAQYIQRGNAVYLEKKCPEHGLFRALIARNAEDYLEWIKNPVINIPPKTVQTEGAPGDDACPLHCGICQNHKQTACCVLMDITNRCNQHCPYCFAQAEEDAADPQEPTLAELEAKFDLLLQLGEERPFNIQLSGGEPTVREDLPEIIRMAQEKGFPYVQINSNGRRLALEDGYAQKLKRAGASVIFMQFDGTTDAIYRELRGEPLLEIKKKAIENCRKAGLPVTLVPTIVKNVNLENIGAMMEFLLEHIAVVKGIHFQPVSFFGRCPEHPDDRQGADAIHEDFENRVTMFDVLRELEKQTTLFKRAEFSPIATGHTLCCFYSTYLKEQDGTVKCLVSREQREAGISCCDAADATSCCGGAHDRTEAAGAETCCCSESDSVSAAVTACCYDVETADGCSGGTPDGTQASASCCGGEIPDPLEIIRKDRDYVLNKWDLPEEPEDEPAGCCDADREGAGISEAGCCDGDVGQQESCCCGAEETPMDLDGFLDYYKRNTFTVTGMAFQDGTNLDAERLKRCRVQVLTEENRLVPFCGYNSIYRGEKR